MKKILTCAVIVVAVALVLIVLARSRQSEHGVTAQPPTTGETNSGDSRPNSGVVLPPAIKETAKVEVQGTDAGETVARGPGTAEKRNLPPSAGRNGQVAGKEKLGDEFVKWWADRIRPEPAKEEDFKKVQFSTCALPKVQDCKAYFVGGLLPLLEAEKNTNNSLLKLKLTRGTDGGIQVTVSSYKAMKTLVVDFGKQTFKRLEPGEGVGDTPSSFPPGEEYSGVSIGFGKSFKDRAKQCISINLPQEGTYKKLHTEIAYEFGKAKNSQIFCSLSFPIAATAKNEGDEVRSVLLIDYRRPALVWEIELPDFARKSNPDYVLDREDGLLAGMGSDMNWLMIIDLKKLVDGGMQY